MKKTLFFLLIFLAIVAIGVGYYAWKFITPVAELPSEGQLIETGAQQPSSPATSNFEDDFYQDLSEFFGENQGYENIQGEFGFTTDEK